LGPLLLAVPLRNKGLSKTQTLCELQRTNLLGIYEMTCNLKKANLVLSFRQEKGMMLFTIENRTEHWLTYEAGIRVPKRDGLYKTSVMPVGPRLSNFESWPHPIDQLALKNFSFTEKPGGKPAKE
jgi:hypothetical protein